MTLENGDPNWTFPFPPVNRQEMEVNCTAISADGSTMLAGTAVWADSNQFEYALWRRTGDTVTKSFSTPWNDGLESWQGVYWVGLCDDGSIGVAAGYTTKGAGLIEIFDADGVVLGTHRPSGAGVEEVMINSDGSVIAWVAGNSYGVGRFNGIGYEFFEQHPGQYCRSVALAPSGEMVLIGCEQSVRWAGISTTGVSEIGHYDTGADDRKGEALKVACTPDFNCFAASISDGRLLFWVGAVADQDNVPLWTTTTEDLGFEPSSTGYALTMQPHDTGVTLIWGTNVLQPGGFDPQTAFGWLTRVDWALGDDAPVATWQNRLTYCPNPGLVLSADCSRVAACDGQPWLDKKHFGKETPGYFYYFDGSGNSVWPNGPYYTKRMNWGVDMTPDHSALFCGSDTGEVFLWVAETADVDLRDPDIDLTVAALDEPIES